MRPGGYRTSVPQHRRVRRPVRQNAERCTASWPAHRFVVLCCNSTGRKEGGVAREQGLLEVRVLPYPVISRLGLRGTDANRKSCPPTSRTHARTQTTPTPPRAQNFRSYSSLFPAAPNTEGSGEPRVTTPIRAMPRIASIKYCSVPRSDSIVS